MKITVKSIEGFPLHHIGFKVGKHKLLNLDVVEFLARATGESKSYIKRLIEQGGVDVMLPVTENEKNSKNKV